MTVDADEGKKAEEQPGSVAQLQATLNVLPAYAWYTAPSGGLTFVNKRTADYLGVPEDHPLRFGIDIGAPWDAHIPLLHPDDREESRKARSTSLRTGEAYEFSQRVRNAQGGYRWFLSRAEPLRASDGTILQWVGVNLDIEELKCAEQALRESEAKFRDYAETASDWFWEIGPDYKFTFLTENSFGSDPAHRIGTACWDHALDLETEPEKWRLLQTTLDSRKPFRDFVYCSVGGDGAPIYVKASGKPVFDSHGEFRGYRGTGTDVTASVRVQRAESRLAAIISSSSDAIIGKSLDGIVTSWNAGAEEIFGYEAHEMIGQSITRIIPAELRQEENTILRRVRQGDRIKNYRTVRTRKDGSRVDISLTVSPVFDPSGKVVGASKIARDITAEKQAEAELQLVREELARAARIATLGELTAVIAHEVNQPLTGVVNSGNACLRWLSGETPNLAAARASVERMTNAGNRAAEVIKRVRALIEKAPPKRERLNINDAITEVLTLVHGEIQRKSISLRTDLATNVPAIFGDRIQLQQVILNLILNAIDAMSVTLSPRELLVISAKNETNEVLVTVRDSGTGLDEKSIDQLFEAFYTTKAQGMGIGLAVSRTIVQTHGGLLWARPNTPRGATFMFTLPADDEQAS